MGKGTENEVHCISDNDCYKTPGYPTATEISNTCCAYTKVLAYDPTVQGYIQVLAM